ncbi:hypothetical protein GJ654_00780 [Rhodoblastus acidophilus]|uniref:Uncharacterized protein n=1 Tax=Rhodoblastus acidophilus TaxID=1074 RepID=A0A6N8DGV4_RHOAC|nr:hypothetical protein [Rhodoblastus acidophilus]MCW2272608.1 FMN phosphatase YigB (HAD superfamily) [Rhodoblastus acidophilus]MTV29520.1 hypothetical protein [Rhodoblastus acidophilus]
MFDKALLLSNFAFDMGLPDFRAGSYMGYLLPLARRLKTDHQFISIRFLMNHAVWQKVMRDPRHRDFESDFVVIDHLHRQDLFGSGDNFVLRNYYGTLADDEIEALRLYFDELLGGFVPDLIISWEFPTQFLRALYPEAVVLDLMPGPFMRPPYPRTVAVDPCGVYKNSGLQFLLDGSHSPTGAEMDAHRFLMQHFGSFYGAINAKAKLLELLNAPRNYGTFALVPLQISDYFGFYANCEYRSQDAFLENVMQTISPDTGVIVTQYVSALTSERAISRSKLAFYRKFWPNLLYSESFDRIDNISQYVVPWADVTWSVSSTIGLQAAFYEKEVRCPGRSHLSYLERCQLDRGQKAALMMSRYSFSWDELVDQEQFLLRLASVFKERLNQGGSDFYNDWQFNPKPSELASRCNLSRADEQFASVVTPQASKPIPVLFDAHLKSIDRVECVSFDVFDTLLTRSVYHPRDVFLIVGRRLLEGHREKVPSWLNAKLFAEMRVSAEQAVRRARDADLASNMDAPLGRGENFLSEEITIEEIYTQVVDGWSGSSDLVQLLIELEQAVELSVIRPTRFGALLLSRAHAKQKRILILSDFVHPPSFVEAALELVGVKNYERLYVSSGVGLKKHTGSLFNHVAAELGIERSSILHIGDNRTGDVAKPREAGWRAMHISVPRVRYAKHIASRGIPETSMLSSFAYRTALNLFSCRYKDLGFDFERDPSLFSSREELGYLGLGPLVMSFAEWVLEECRASATSQALFFARDCYLPYRAAKLLQETDPRYIGITVAYLNVSRSAVRGVEFDSPNSVFTVGLDDVLPDTPLRYVLQERFSLAGIEPDADILEQCGISDPDKAVGALAVGQVYEVARLLLVRHWSVLERKFAELRNLYRRHIVEQGGVLEHKAALIDIGYTGTITKALSGLFKGGIEPLFMMTYANELGRSPLDNARAFLGHRFKSVSHESTPFLKYNLIIETLLNEGVGSLALIANLSGSSQEIAFVRENVPESHSQRIAEIHDGAERFFRDWLGLETCFGGALPFFEPNLLLNTLHAVLKNPTIQEASLLQEVVFDNGFAGHQNRVLVPSNASEKGVWNEGGAVLAKQANKASASTAKAPAGPAKAPAGPAKAKAKAIVLPKDLRAQLELASHASRSGDNIIEIGKGLPGHGVYGPYLPLDAGLYRISIGLDALSNGLFQRTAKLAVDVVANGGRDVLAALQLTTADLKNRTALQEIDFEIPEGKQMPFEVRVWTDGRNAVRIREVTLAKRER